MRLPSAVPRTGILGAPRDDSSSEDRCGRPTGSSNRAVRSPRCPLDRLRYEPHQGRSVLLSVCLSGRELLSGVRREALLLEQELRSLEKINSGRSMVLTAVVGLMAFKKGGHPYRENRGPCQAGRHGFA
jgi:hypothetical protein